jgi:murein DD-endopeptidase MepM/ murein hydrolase activator NlpD
MNDELPFVYGDTTTEINNTKDKQDDLNKKLEDTEKQLEELKQQSADTKSYIEQLDSKMSALDASLYELNQKIDDMQVQIEDSEENLQQAQIEADEQYEAMKLRIQFMYEHNSEGYLEILLQSSSLADLLNKADYITKISQYDREKLIEYQETITYIAEVKEQLENDYAELDDMKVSLEEQRQALELVQEAKQTELTALNKQTSATEITKAQYEAEREQLDNELLTLVAQKQKEDAAAAEAASKAAAEAASKAEAEKATSGTVSIGGSSTGTTGNTSTGTASSSGFIWPTVSKRITSPYGDTEDRSSPHKGLDIGAVKAGVSGDPIYAAASGTVIIAKFSSSAGNYITIDHGNGLSTVYMHCSALYVSVGDTVTQGQTIALMGATGIVTGVHLHFAVIKGGQYVNPSSYLP